MKILIDAHMLGEQEGGNETYIAGLLQGFAEIETDANAQISAVYNQLIMGRISTALAGPPLNFTAIATFAGCLQKHQRFVETQGQSLSRDLQRFTFLQSPYVVTIHDVIFRLYPEYFSPRVRLLLSTLMPLSMWRAKAVITVSEASKQEIIRYYPFVRNKIFVTYEAAGPVAQAQPNPDVVQQYTYGQEFILAVGTVQPRKNLVRLVQAYLLLRERQATTARLVIVGRARWQGSEIQKVANNSPYRQDIIFTGYLDDPAVAALYQACSVFVYPSLYEGFGLPVLEAMALGAPVVTSNISSLPEVAGNAAMLIDPYSVDEIANAIKSILTQPGQQTALQQAGLQRAAQFSWQQTARTTLDVYKWALEH